jgi:hypothetical protein
MYSIPRIGNGQYPISKATAQMRISVNAGRVKPIEFAQFSPHATLTSDVTGSESDGEYCR